MAFLWILQTTAVAFAVWTVGEAIRRLYFHPLAPIPGPRLAALTWWYEFYYDAIQPGHYVFKIQELHRQYGPIIRVTPDEIHISDVGFLDTVYAPSMMRRCKYAYQLRSLRVPGGVGTTADYNLHKIRREALTPFFRKKNILYLEGLITDKVTQLKELIATHAAQKTPVNLSDVFFAFSNDVVTNFLFAHQTDILSDETKAATLRHNSKELMMGINFNKHFPQIPDFLEALPVSISGPMMPPGLIDMLSLFDRVRNELVAITCTKESGLAADKPVGPTGKESVYDSVLDNPNLPASEKTLLRLEQEGALLALAGTESPAQTLNITFYHLLANPTLLQKLRDELSGVPISAPWSQLEQLPYLSAVIEEGNRLSFGVTARTARIADEPLTYTPSSHVPSTCPPSTKTKSYTIPPGTPVSITTLAAHTAESVFPNPYLFDPERWLGNAGKERRKFQMAFGKGGRKCLGIELARAELYLVIAALVRGFDMTLFETDTNDVAFLHDYQVAMPKMGSKGSISYVVYQVWLHPLAIYPGPFIAKLTDLYSVSHAVRGDRHEDTYRLHERYGRIVRIGPNRVTILDAGALRPIYGHQGNVQKSQWYSGFYGLSIFNTIDRSDHARRRRVISHAFSDQAVRAMEPHILTCVRDWCLALGDCHPIQTPNSVDDSDRWSRPKDMVHWSACIIFDALGEICFGKTFNTSLSDENTFFLPLMALNVRIANISGQMPVLRRLGLETYLRRGTAADRERQIALSQQQLTTRLAANPTQRRDIIYFLQQARDPETGQGYSEEELIGEAYLRACVEESMRLCPLVPMDLPREVLPGGLCVLEWTFPTGTIVGVPTYSLHHSAEHFEEPFRFNPSRWLLGDLESREGVTAEVMARQRQAFVPFSLGPRSCIGRKVAIVELELCIARALWLYDVRLAPGFKHLGIGREGEYKMKDNFIVGKEGPVVELRARELY
ncbi:putative Cytochrome P450 [Aspergillus affinis]|uniref:putative Cytochrome P450 n=1 Tax=Aspergillus affinis TaxID=1070780 RepID=UPI0022FF2C67|nr:putative Cytochrome P450 [Aspergillus affinis]KAI9041023.1 putative Cytochrome P450 [Aspergillus affinis]